MIIENKKEEFENSLKMAVSNIQYIQKMLGRASAQTVENFLETVKAQVEEALKIAYKNTPRR